MHEKCFPAEARNFQIHAKDYKNVMVAMSWWDAVSRWLTQLVHHTTRKQAVLDKIYSNIEDGSLLSFRVLAHQITTQFHSNQDNPSPSATITELKSRFVAMTQMVKAYWQITWLVITGMKWNRSYPSTRKSNTLIIIFWLNSTYICQLTV